MNYIIMHETVTNHDAIGNDIEAMFKILNENDHCFVFAVNQMNSNVIYIDKKEIMDLVVNPETVLIYHHSVYWEFGYETLQKARCHIIIKYHNITPAKFFQEYNDFYFRQCDEGRKMTEAIVKNVKDAFWLCDSIYNASEIPLSEERIGICPPFHKIEEWNKAKPNETILQQLVNSDEINLLFVGRVAPNKGHLDAIEVLYYFCRCYHRKIKLRVIGKFDDGIAKYNKEIRDYIDRHQLKNHIEFIGETTDSDLLSYYLGSDLMLCYSHHEGFCVPIIEAQCLGLPVIALASTAVPETIGEGQVCLEDDKRLFTAAIGVIARDPTYVRFLRKKGYQNYASRFTYQIIRDTFIKELERGIRINESSHCDSASTVY